MIAQASKTAGNGAPPAGGHWANGAGHPARDRPVINPVRGEVAMPFGDDWLVLRFSWRTIAMLGDVFPAEEGREWNWPVRIIELFGPLSVGSSPAAIMKIAHLVAVAAHEHHPELTIERIMDTSPSLYLTEVAVVDAVRAALPQAAEETEDGAKRAGPFGLATLLTMLSKLRQPTASPTPSSGASPRGS